MPDKKDPDELIQMTHDGKTFSQVPRFAFDEVWSLKGWKEADPAKVTAAAVAEAHEDAEVPVK